MIKACHRWVVWKGQCGDHLGNASPEQGWRVIVTGTHHNLSGLFASYQIVIESMEPAGVGALLAQLEKAEGAAAAEGLFEPTRNSPLPAMRRQIGVITSPTGAVIRDILHRIRDRWPCQVVVWPVVVQGDQRPPR